MSLGWQQLHTLIGIEPTESSESVYTGIGSLNDAGPEDVSFLGNTRYQPQLAETKAGVVLVPVGEFVVPDDCRLITVANPSASFSKLIAFFQSKASSFIPGVSLGAHVAESAALDPRLVQVSPGAVIEAGAQIGRGTIIGAGCLVGRDVKIGEDCLLHPGSIVRERCSLGNRVILQPGCVIGSDGYGFELVNGRHQKVAQVGIVEIQDDVEVGANSCIDRARFGKTIIGEGTKIDNLVQVAHNVRTGKHCLLVAQCGLAGSSSLGNYVTMAAQSGLAGHLEVADETVISAKSALMKSVTKPGVYMGMPARPMAGEQRKMAAIARLPKLREELQELKKKLEELTGE